MSAFRDLAAIPPQGLSPGYLARAVHGARITLAIVEIDPHAFPSQMLGESQRSVARLFERTLPDLARRGRPTVVLLDEVESSIGLERLRALHVNDSAAPLGSNRDRHANIGEGLLGEKLGVFLGNPRLQGLPAVLETAGPEKRGPDANEVRKAKEIHARAIAG